jgi:hypothetical protein
MTWRQYLLLALLGLFISGLVAAFQSTPGYMDADYYYANGLRLASGAGFSEPFLWNYLDNPSGLPHPADAYWMPLASMLVAAGSWLFGVGSWTAARTGFLLVCALLPPLTAALAWSLTARRSLAMASGLLAVFSGYYLPLQTTTDTFAIYLLLGACFFLLLAWRAPARLRALLLGLTAGCMHLTRADGLLWLLLAVLAVLWVLPRSKGHPTAGCVLSVVLVGAGYLLVMAPWFYRNLLAFGAPLAPGAAHLFWLTSYNQLFSFPASGITFAGWWGSGLAAILQVRLWAAGLNLENAMAVQGGIVIFPLTLLGLWQLRGNRSVQLAGAAWVLTFLAMTVVYPFAGAHGGYLHSGTATQSMLWAAAPLGLEQLIQWGVKRRRWVERHARRLLLGEMVGLALLVSMVVGLMRLPTWDLEMKSYQAIAATMQQEGMQPGQVVIVADPPAFWLASGEPSIAVPDGGEQMVLSLAARYGARYLILEQGSIPAPLQVVYDQPREMPGLTYLGKVKAAHLYEIQP